MKEDHQHAFPTLKVKDVEPGMTLRDYFAAAALTGLLANPDRVGRADEFALDAYKTADKMIEVRGGQA